jgi:DNA polymerase-3 subunit beta
LDAVRFAASADPELPMLGGVLFETDEAGTLTLVATDRYRLARASAAAVVDGPPVSVLLPLALVDAVRPGLDDMASEVRCEVDGGRVRVAGFEGTAVDAAFPDHRRLVRAGGTRQITVDSSALRLRVEAAPNVRREQGGTSYQILVFGSELTLADEGEWAADQNGHVAVNREFLLEAVAAAGGGQLVLELDGPIAPLAIRPAGDAARISILMPVRHTGAGG